MRKSAVLSGSMVTTFVSDISRDMFSAASKRPYLESPYLVFSASYSGCPESSFCTKGYIRNQSLGGLLYCSHLRYMFIQ